MMHFTPWSRTRTHRHTTRCGLLLVGAMTVTRAAGASAQGGLSEAAYLEDVPVVLSAARLAQPVTEAPAAVTMIDREMIEASGFRQIADLFRLVPGFTVAYFNGYTPSVTYHGFADEFSERMQVLIDGRSVYLPSIGGVDWSALSITVDDIERIEVIRGSDSATYGANSFLGVISITTRHPAEDKGTSLTETLGTHNVRDTTLRYGAGTNALSYHLTLSHLQDDGFDNRYDTSRTQLLNGRVDYQLGVNDTLESAFGLNEGPRQTGSLSDDTDPPHDKNIHSHFEQLRWLHSSGATQEFSVQFYHNYHDTDEDFLTAPIGDLGGMQLPLSNDIKAERYDLEFQHTLTPFRDLRLVWGASAREDRVTAPAFFATNATLDSRLTRLFGNAEWRIVPSFVTNFGATLERNDITGSQVSPRLAGNWHLDTHQTLRLVISTATRTPLLFEDQGNYKIPIPEPFNLTDQLILGTRSVGNENILSREVGYLFNWPEHGTALDIKAFDDVLKDMIRRDYCKDVPNCLSLNSNVVDYNNSFLVYHNASAAQVHGAEFQLDQQLGSSTRLIAGYARILITHDSDHSPFQSAPKDSFHLMLIQHIQTDTLASLAYYQNDDMEYLGSGNHTDIQRRLDLRLGHTFRLDADKFKTALVIQNLLGNYQDFLYTKDTKNLFDRRAFIEVGYELP